MDIVIDTSAVIAVITKAPDREALLAATQGATVFSPRSLPWEVGNAFSAMFKQRRITIAQALEALALYHRLPVHLVEVSLAQALTLAAQQHMYAYDAYMLICAQRQRAALLTLDTALLRTARMLGVPVVAF
jgi:predicted nucleic acid-binding protein